MYIKALENTEMIHKAYEIMRNINEIVGENTDYDEAVDEELMVRLFRKIDFFYFFCLVGTSKIESSKSFIKN